MLQDESKGVLDIRSDGTVRSFREKKELDASPINAGYMVLNPEIFSYIEGDAVAFEKEPLERLTREGELMSYIHRGFWQCMDTLREKKLLESLWEKGEAPWKKWKE